MISVVTPSFNQSDWLRLCVASVADQAGVEHEHLVQDARSADGTQDWLARDNRVVAVSEPDHGMYDAINRGLRRATGEICAYLNCDEQYLPATLARVAAYFRDHPEVDLLFGDVILVDENGQPVSYRRTVLPDRAHIRAAHLNTTS
ncbi:MAG: glycosyltransferase, partial [Chthoniobacterales bacterium]|nr:glycosyltransferase [Chthoniobacterales bacterium]